MLSVRVRDRHDSGVRAHGHIVDRASYSRCYQGSVTSSVAIATTRKKRSVKQLLTAFLSAASLI